MNSGVVQGRSIQEISVFKLKIWKLILLQICSVCLGELLQFLGSLVLLFEDLEFLRVQ